MPQHTSRRRLLRLIFAAPILSSLLFPAPGGGQPPPHVVISEIYGGGGNSGATYTHDFIELYNPTPSDVAMTGWSVQYQSGGGTGQFGAVAIFSGIIPSHGFFLIQANPGSGGTVPLPAPDAIAGFSMAATSGKVALSSDTLPVAGPGDSLVVDFAGYGSANMFEGSGPAAAPGNTTSIERKASAGSDEESMSAGGSEEHSGNARDSDDNLGDFITRGPDPQNAASPAEAPGGEGSLAVPYGRGWNLVSVPLSAGDPAAGNPFPGAMTPLYRYESGYIAETSAVPGTGYWVRFAEPETALFADTPLEPETLSLVQGWNLIGASTTPLVAGDVLQVPGGHLAGAFYGYEGGYLPADSLRPGRGYWVRSTTGGLIIFPPSPGRALRTADRAGP